MSKAALMEILILLQKSLQYSFMQKALICGILIAISSSMLGVFLVLRKFSLISDGLSHVSFATVAIALVCGLSPTLVSIPLVILASLLITKLTEKTNLYGDSAIGLVSGFSLAIGVTIISIGKGFNVDIYSYLFGSILAISNTEVILSLILTVIVIVVISIFYNDLFIMSFDSEYAKITKINIKAVNLFFVIIQSITIVIGIKVVGAMLISSLIIFPTITSLQVAKRFKNMLIFSIIISVFSVTAGIFISFILNTPTGSTIVITNTIIFLIILLINKIFKIK